MSLNSTVPAELQPIFKSLATKALELKQFDLKTALCSATATQRVTDFSLEAAGIHIDYSKNLLDQPTLDLLLEWLRLSGLAEKRQAMFSGAKINHTEQRSVLHIALRAPADSTILVDGNNVMPEVSAVLEHMYAFAEKVRNGDWLGSTGKRITHIVNIGIGGSDLGPAMASQALHAYQHPELQVHFVSNVDGADLYETLQLLPVEQTLFVICSKTFKTLETMTNAHIARNWAMRELGDANKLKQHFVAVSTNQQAVIDFGIDPNNMFPFWDWVGGRYSVWSAVGLSLLLQIGKENFAQFLAGAHAMDQHFLTAPLKANAPCLLAVIGAWYNNFLDAQALNIAPYAHGLRRFAAYLQQLDMESNGKQIQADGTPVGMATSPIIWGEAGTNGQHAYFQCLHQGTHLIPIDFIAALKPSYPLVDSHQKLLANCFAQSKALAFGKTKDEVMKELRTQGVPEQQALELAPHKCFPGNRPSTTLLLDQLDPYHLGALIALYEHKVFVQGVLWNLNSFDQWGVELGKVLAVEIEQAFHQDQVDQLDASTAQMVKLYKQSNPSKVA